MDIDMRVAFVLLPVIAAASWESRSLKSPPKSQKPRVGNAHPTTLY